MNARKLVLPVVLLMIVAVTSADAGQRHGGTGGAARAGRSGPSQGPAVPRAAAPVHGGPYGGGATGGYGYYRPYNYRPYYGYPYHGGYYPYYRSYPYYYYPGFSIAFGFGFPVGYSSFYYGYPYPYASPYPYPYPYAYPYPYGAGNAYPPASSPDPAPDTSSPAPTSNYPRSGLTAAASGGVTFEITPETAEVYADGNFVGVVADFAPSAQPLTLRPGRHHIELRAPGYQPMVLDGEIAPGRVVPYRGTMQRLREQKDVRGVSAESAPR